MRDRPREERPNPEAAHGERQAQSTADCLSLAGPNERRQGSDGAPGPASAGQEDARRQRPSSHRPPPVRGRWRGPAGCATSPRATVCASASPLAASGGARPLTTQALQGALPHRERLSPPKGPARDYHAAHTRCSDRLPSAVTLAATVHSWPL